MIKLLHVHHVFLNVKKNNLIILIFSYIIIFMVIYFSKLYYSYDKLLFNKELFLDSYLINTLNIFKVTIILQIIFLIISNFVINNYDIYLITEQKRSNVVISKVIVSLISLLTITSTLYLAFLVIWMITPYDFDKTLILGNFMALSLFSVYYFCIGLCLYFLFRTIYVLILPFFGYIISSFSIDYGSRVEDLSDFSKTINILFPDLMLIDKQFIFIYDNLFVVSLGLVFLVNITIVFNRKDF